MNCLYYEQTGNKRTEKKNFPCEFQNLNQQNWQKTGKPEILRILGHCNYLFL